MAKTVLVIDDDHDMLDLLRNLLTEEGYQVWTADSAFSAQEILHNDVPDAVVLDIMMPDRPGIELLENIRWDPRLKELPVICLSAGHLSAETLEFIQEFSFGLVDKANLGELLERLREILAEK